MSTLRCLIFGLPNVGKSLFINQIGEKNRCLVLDEPGVTRDILSLKLPRDQYVLELMDSPGVDELTSKNSEENWSAQLTEVTKEAVKNAHVVLFMIDGQIGVRPLEKNWSRWLIKQNKLVICLINKTDDESFKNKSWEAFQLGFSSTFFISSLHKRGFSDVFKELDQIAQKFGLQSKPPEYSCSFSIIGRPNVGKSSLLNALTKKQLSFVSQTPGTTRDPVEGIVRYQDQLIQIFDTAGVRRHAKRAHPLEFYSVEWAYRAIQETDLSLLVIDASLGWTDQDKRLADLLYKKRQTTIVVYNKWDLVTLETRTLLADTSPKFIESWEHVRISVKSNRQIFQIIPKILKLHERQKVAFKTSFLNQTLQDLLLKNQRLGKSLKIKYLTQIEGQPPIFKVFGKQVESLKPHLKTYFEKQLKKALQLKGIPILILWTDN
jgi:GTP-binding protein